MRVGSACSILLHGAIVAALAWGFLDKGGAPDIGGGGAQAIEVVLYSPEEGTNAETPTTAEAEIADEDVEATQVAARPAPRRPSTPTPPPPPAAAAPPLPTQVTTTEEMPPIVAPPGDQAIVPPIPADMVRLPDDLEALLVPPRPVEIEVEMPEELEVALQPPPKPVEPPPVEVKVDLPAELEDILEPPPEPVEVSVDMPEELEALLEPPPPEPVAEAAVQPPDDIVPPEKPTREVKLPDVKQTQAKRKEPPKEEEKKSEEARTQGTPGQQLAVAPQKGTANGTEATPSDAGAQSVGVAAGKLQSYNGLLLAWLEKHKRYPDGAQRRKHEGIVTVEFTIDSDGNVLRHRVVSDSGYELLDAEADALLARASPLPAPPQEITQRTWQVPIVFELR